jgi:hypothetical protein
VYKREERDDGTSEVRCEYKIHALHMKFKYYMVHYVDSDKGCVVWKLDYNRDSDLDDSVGYWCAKMPTRGLCPVVALRRAVEGAATLSVSREVGSSPLAKHLSMPAPPVRDL